MKNLGELIKEARESQRLTQYEVAEELRVARTTVSNWECGRAEPDLRTLRMLSSVLKFDLLDEHTENTIVQEDNTRKLRLKLSDSPVIEVVSLENACVFSDFTVNLQETAVIYMETPSNSVFPLTSASKMTLIN